MNKLILLVEDNPSDVKLTQRAFKKSGIVNELAIARDGQEALDFLFNADNDLPVVVLLDIRLPRVDGHDVLKAMRANPRTALLPVVILTSSKEQADLVNSYSEGANSFVRKPIDFNEFVGALKTLQVYWLLTNIPPPNKRG